LFAKVNITNQVGVVCDEATRQRLIAQRERLLHPQALPEPVAKL